MAIRAWETAVQKNPDNFESWYNLGVTFLQSNKIEKAIAALHSAVRIKPKYADTWVNIMNLLFSSFAPEQHTLDKSRALPVPGYR
jgi:cytochrome c-type biogenesis protein CcmH/NrfG